VNEQLKHAMKQEDTVLFIGSGISCWAGLPSWTGLINRLADYLEASGGDAEIVRRELKHDSSKPRATVSIISRLHRPASSSGGRASSAQPPRTRFTARSSAWAHAASVPRITISSSRRACDGGSQPAHSRWSLTASHLRKQILSKPELSILSSSLTATLVILGVLS
jgi:hypothetical protein